jgi:tripartite ATP-independent transporter DctP family solute receptor
LKRQYQLWWPAFSLMLLATASPVLAQTKLVLSHNAEAGTPRAVAALKFSELVKAGSHGRLSVEVNPGGKVGENLEMLTHLRDGTLDISINFHGTLSTVVPEVAAFGLPYAFSSPKKMWEILDGDVGQDLAQKIESQDMIALAWMDAGSYHISNRKRPIVKPEDLRALKIRTTSDKAMTDTLSALGALPMPISFSDLYEALKTGYADGQQNSLVNFKQKNLHEVQKYLSLTYHSYGLAPLLMSRKKWNVLSADDRKTVQEAAREAAELQRKLAAEADEKIIDEYKKAGVLQISKPDPAPFKAATQKVWDSWELKPFGEFVKKLRAAAN